MSYTFQPPGQRSATAYPLVPLSQAPIVPVTQADSVRRLIITVVAILALLALAWLAKSAMKPRLTKNQAAKKLSTPELAKQLYERLEKRGRANPAVLRSLQSYASRR